MPNLPALAQPPLLEIAPAQRPAVPLREEERSVRDQCLKQLMDALLPLLCKVAPNLSDDAAGRWRVAMAEALSDLPAHIAINAARQSLSAQLRIDPRRKADAPSYRPIQRTGEIETLVRQQAEALRRREQIRTVRRPEPPPPIAYRPEPPATAADVDEMNRIMRRFGIERRWQLVDGRCEPILSDAERRQQQREKRRTPLP